MNDIFALLMLPAIIMFGISLLFTSIFPSFGSVSSLILLGIFVLIVLYSCWDLIAAFLLTVAIWIARVVLALVAVLIITKVVRWIHQSI